MSFSVRTPDPKRNFAHQVQLEVLAQIIPPDVIHAVLAEHQALASRVRKLSAEAVGWFLLALNLYADLALAEVYPRMTRSLRLLWPHPKPVLPSASALVYRRYPLGVRPLRALFQRICQPLAQSDTPGAFRFGLRLLAIDGHVEPVPDTPANEAVFGRHRSQRGPAAFPQVRIVSLCECATHAVLDAGFWPVHTGEQQGAARLLHTLLPGALVLWGRGFYSYDLVHAVRASGSQLLCRIAGDLPWERRASLPDGSTLAELRPGHKQPQRQRRQTVRIIEYVCDDPAFPEAGQRQRLLTTLLDPGQAPALDLARTYHERWEYELMVDEVATHQHLGDGPLRSRKPTGIMQELYALLLMHYALRALMYAAAHQAQVDPDRVSFTHSLRIVQDAVRDFQLAAARAHRRLRGELLRELTEKLLPPRRPRLNPRVVKRKMSNFKLKREEHYHWPQPTRSFAASLRVLMPPGDPRPILI